MPIRRPLAAAVAAAALLAAFDARSASDYLLKYDGIEGESTLKGFEKHIEIASWSWGVSPATTGNGARLVGKACPSDVSLSKAVDKATPPLIAGAVGGSVSPTAILIGLRPGGGGGAPQVYLKIQMKNVMVSSYQTSGSSGGGTAMDAFSVRFQSAKVSYFPQNADGSVGKEIVEEVQAC